MRSKKIWHLKSCCLFFFFLLLTFPVSASGVKASVHLLASQLMRSWNKGVLLCFPLAHHNAFSLESGHRVKMRKEECKTHYVLVSCCEQIDTELAFFQLSPSPVCFPRFAFLAPSDVVGSVLLTGKLCLQTFCQTPQNADIKLSEIVPFSCFRNFWHVLYSCSYKKAELGNNVDHQIRFQEEVCS